MQHPFLPFGIEALRVTVIILKRPRCEAKESRAAADLKGRYMDGKNKGGAPFTSCASSSGKQLLRANGMAESHMLGQL